MNKIEAMYHVRAAKMEYTLYEDQHEALYDFLSQQDFPKGAKVVELGCAYGRTSLLLAYICREQELDFHAVDCFILTPEYEYRRVMFQSGLPFTLHVARTSSATIPTMPDLKEIEWSDTVSLLYVDASHNEPWFPSDMEKWIPLVTHGGIVIFDDWEEPNLPEPGNPHWAVAHYGEIYTKSWKDLGWVGRLRVKQNL